MRFLAPAAFALLIAGPALAQSPDLRRAGLPRQEARRLEAVIEDPGTLRYDGDALIASGDVVDGSVFVHRGILTVAGTIRGELIVVDGDVVFEPGASVNGDVTVIGGTIQDAPVAVLAGTVTEYGEGFGLLARARELHDGRADWRADRWGDRDYDWRSDVGHANFEVRVADNYNRVEGLPIQLGPDLRTGGAYPTRFEALAVWRTDVGPLTNTGRMGYVARAEQFFGVDQAFRIGASVRSTIHPIESWYMTDMEASLSAALFHEDQRDYFEREGWSAYVRIDPPRSPVDLTLEYRDERHRTVVPRDPWTLFNDAHIWRGQPLVAEGDIRLVGGSLRWDTRRGGDFAYRGWYAAADVLRGIDGSLEIPVTITDPGAPPNTLFEGKGLAAGLIDVRRYVPLGWDGSLGMRAVAGGSLDGNALAPQFQHALGGAGTLPGYPLLSADCGARRVSVTRPGDPQSVGLFRSYGCDRFALVQVEYRGGLDFHFGGNDDRDDGPWHYDANVDWTVFMDAGRGWTLGDDPARSDTETLFDAGAGLILGGLGIYGAVPLTGDDRAMRFFVRLGPRF